MQERNGELQEEVRWHEASRLASWESEAGPPKPEGKGRPRQNKAPKPSQPSSWQDQSQHQPVADLQDLQSNLMHHAGRPDVASPAPSSHAGIFQEDQSPGQASLLNEDAFPLKSTQHHQIAGKAAVPHHSDAGSAAHLHNIQVRPTGAPSLNFQEGRSDDHSSSQPGHEANTATGLLQPQASMQPTLSSRHSMSHTAQGPWNRATPPLSGARTGHNQPSLAGEIASGQVQAFMGEMPGSQPFTDPQPCPLHTSTQMHAAGCGPAGSQPTHLGVSQLPVWIESGPADPASSSLPFQGPTEILSGGHVRRTSADNVCGGHGPYAAGLPNSIPHTADHGNDHASGLLGDAAAPSLHDQNRCRAWKVGSAAASRRASLSDSLSDWQAGPQPAQPLHARGFSSSHSTPRHSSAPDPWGLAPLQGSYKSAARSQQGYAMTSVAGFAPKSGPDAVCQSVGAAAMLRASWQQQGSGHPGPSHVTPKASMQSLQAAAQQQAQDSWPVLHACQPPAEQGAASAGPNEGPLGGTTNSAYHLHDSGWQSHDGLSSFKEFNGLVAQQTRAHDALCPEPWKQPPCSKVRGSWPKSTDHEIHRTKRLNMAIDV